MPRRSYSQRIGDQAENLAQGAFLKAPNWVCRSQTHDFGIDLEAELAIPMPTSEILSGAIVKLQVKGTIKPIHRNRAYYVRLKTDFLRYANQFRIPVILLLVNVRNGEIHYLWIQEYLNGREQLLRKGQSVLVRIPEENDLQSSLAHELPEVALGVTTGAKLMAVQDLFRVFSNGYNQRALQLSSELLKLISNDGHLSIFNNAIEKLIERGPYLSRVDSQEFGKVLMELTRRFGDELSAEQVFQMVARGENISSAGLDGLSGLYDGFPDHAIKLDLSEFFDAKGYHELSWYCQFRQAHKALNSVTIWDRISGLQTQFKTRAGALTITDEDRDYCYRKWPNRGDVVYLHALSLPSP